MGRNRFWLTENSVVIRVKDKLPGRKQRTSKSWNGRQFVSWRWRWYSSRLQPIIQGARLVTVLSAWALTSWMCQYCHLSQLKEHREGWQTTAPCILAWNWSHGLVTGKGDWEAWYQSTCFPERLSLWREGKWHFDGQLICFASIMKIFLDQNGNYFPKWHFAFWMTKWLKLQLYFWNTIFKMVFLSFYPFIYASTQDLYIFIGCQNMRRRPLPSTCLPHVAVGWLPLAFLLHPSIWTALLTWRRRICAISILGLSRFSIVFSVQGRCSTSGVSAGE